MKRRLIGGMNVKLFLAMLLAVFMGGCVIKPAGPPVNTNFVFNPPSSVQSTKNSMSIAILTPSSRGSFFKISTDSSESHETISNFFMACRSDLERVIIAKGFTTSGAYMSYDEMTFSQKERSTLILKPEIYFNITVQRGLFGEASKATVSGNILIEFLEPMSKEKVWVKQFDLPATVQDVDLVLLKTQGGYLAKNPDGSLQYTLASNSRNSLLNDFYANAFAKIWDQLDSREISALKKDADKLKSRTHYRGN